jgi:hypothetical protein
MKNRDELKTQIIHRPGGNTGGTTRHERFSVDFLVNRASLYKLLGADKLDMIGRFSKETPDWNSKSVEVFIQKLPPDLGNGRVMLYVCSECGDIGCGAITMQISKNNDEYIWSLFAYENDYDLEMTDYVSYKSVGPFRFSTEQYEQVIHNAGNSEPWCLLDGENAR